MDITTSIKKYKNSVTRKYISISNDEVDTIKKGEYWLSKKFDGQLWFYCKSNKNSSMSIVFCDNCLTFLFSGHKSGQ